MTHQPVPANPVVVIGQQFLAPYPVDLTIKSKTWSLTEGCFGVTDVNGAVLFSIKGKIFSLRDRRILLDNAGNPLVSLQQKILSAHRRWQVFRGDSANDKNLLFSVKKSSLIQFKTELSVFLANNTKENVPDFKVKGSWLERSCTIYLGDSNTIVAQMRKKYTATSILLDKDCFAVTVYPNVDYAFIVALVVILQEINEDRSVGSNLFVGDGTIYAQFQLCITIGILAANVLNYFFAKMSDYGWRLALGGAMVPAFILTIGSFFLPDTPNSLIERGKRDEAKDRLMKIRGIDNVDEEFDDLVAASDRSMKVKHPWKNIFQRKYRPQLTFAICIPLFQQLTGNNVYVFYAPVLFKTMGFGSSASLMYAVITNGVNFIATLVSIVGVDTWGRRSLFIEGGSQMFICQCIITTAISWKFGLDGNPGVLPHWYAYNVVATICVYVAGFAWSWGPLGWLVPSEIFPLEIRSAAQSINVGVNMLLTFAIAQVSTAMLCHMKFGLFIFFAGWVLIMSLFIKKLLPETKGVPIEEMTIVWQKHPYWSKFVGKYDETIEISEKKVAAVL